MNIMIKQEALNTPFFTVIINCHNSESYLRGALASVVSQTFLDYEVIIFDNASTDATAKISKDFGADIHYYFSEVKLTLGAARNRAIMKAEGKYIAFLDSDDVWIPSKLAAQHAGITERDSIDCVGLCGSDALRVAADLTPIARYSLGRIRPKKNVMTSLMYDCFIPMSSTAVNRRVCIDLGGFDESYEIVEEWDLWIRIARKFEVVYLPECLVQIRFHGSNTSKNYVGQDNEIKRMLAGIETSGIVEKKTMESVRATWAMRYKIVQLFNSSNDNLKGKAKQVVQLIIFSLQNPRVFLSLARSYFSIRLIRFAVIKYFNE
jgi:glycosyltransferase involved in cell wall biosynthesis